MHPWKKTSSGFPRERGRKTFPSHARTSLSEGGGHVQRTGLKEIDGGVSKPEGGADARKKKFCSSLTPIGGLSKRWRIKKLTFRSGLDVEGGSPPFCEKKGRKGSGNGVQKMTGNHGERERRYKVLVLPANRPRGRGSNVRGSLSS